MRELEEEFSYIERKKETGLIGIIEYQEERVKLKENKLNLLKNKINYLHLYLDLQMLLGEDLYENRGGIIAN